MIFCFGGYELDAALFELRLQGERVAMEKRVIDVLLYLVRNRDRVVLREELHDACWPGVMVEGKSLDQVIYVARKFLCDDAAQPQMIETIRGRGWRFVADVGELAPNA